jgi:hypothetical protein
MGDTPDLTAPIAAVPPWRMVAGGVVGYVLVATIVVMTTVGLAGMLGPDRIFEPGSYRSTASFEWMNLAAGVVAAMVGGAAAWAIGRRIAAVVLLFTLLVGGFVSGITALRAQEARTEPWAARPDGEWGRMAVAAENTQHGLPYLLGMPIAGAVGVLAGSLAAAGVSRRSAPPA